MTQRLGERLERRFISTGLMGKILRWDLWLTRHRLFILLPYVIGWVVGGVGLGAAMGFLAADEWLLGSVFTVLSVVSLLFAWSVSKEGLDAIYNREVAASEARAERMRTEVAEKYGMAL